MNIESLRMFCRVVEEGSVTKAAKLGFVSQPAVTRQIRNLENSYGVALFEREDGKLKKTEAGQILYSYAKEILCLYKASFESIQEHQGMVQQTLHIGASPTIGEYLLPSLIGQFKRSHSLGKFTISIGNTPRILEELEENKIDIALVESAFQHQNFQKKEFANDRLIIVAAFNHPWSEDEEIDLFQLAEEKMLWRESESGTRLLVESALEQYGVLEQMEDTMELGSVQAIKSAVEANLGISILPELTVQKELTYKTLKELHVKNFELTRDFYVVQKKRRFKKDIQKYFEKFLLME
ncbi:LysR family transcriptional regulator [Pseudogracilibacillus auburnensis]|uniref:DNA-binding transcriptional LysR family regulator n=1 Tax=Pseudogracilibacillus auburnensis TaxID=1494959 RepID=A0A2V3VRB9_9BACI|nr:LysR family transcriptional regulator [Pseudogracilibacillus auburnensis]PXW83371.1 DNA-binding transcriptional LysR family regulator [Pseudogracilibacillus auburnensis]